MTTWYTLKIYPKVAVDTPFTTWLLCGRCWLQLQQSPNQTKWNQRARQSKKKYTPPSRSILYNYGLQAPMGDLDWVQCGCTRLVPDVHLLYLPVFILTLWDCSIITLFLSSLFSLQTLQYTPPCSLSNSWPIFSMNYCYIHICICIYAPKYINTTCPVCIMLYVYMFSGLDHLVLDNQSLCSSLGKTICPVLRIS